MSKWASPIVIVPKTSAPGEPPKRRLCIDFRKVNELQQEITTAGKTKGQISIHQLPKIDEMYEKLKGAKVFSTIDLRSGYHHITLGKSSRAKTAFVTPFGKYKFLMVPFGLAQAPAYFQLLMKKVLEGLNFAMTYCCVAPLWLLSLNPFIEFRIWNNSSSSDVLYIQASISISPKYESKSKTTSHCHLLLHDCTNVAV